MGASGGVTRSTLRQQIADALRDEVLAGRLRPRVEFTVKQIAEQYGVSATPVREALFDLSAQGLLESDQHRGFRVREFSVADYRAMVEARALVIDGVFRRIFDGTGSASAVIGAHRAALVSVRRRGEEASRAARGGDLDILIGYDLRFWRSSARSSATPTSATSCNGCGCRPGPSPSRICAVTATAYATGCGTVTGSWWRRSRWPTGLPYARCSTTTTRTG